MPATNRPAIPVAPRQSVLILIDALRIQIVALHHGFVGEDNRYAKATYLRHEARMFETLSAETGRSMNAGAGRARDMERGGMVFAGSPNEVADRILHLREELGHSRQIIQMDVGGMPHATFLNAIELLGDKVLPQVRKATSQHLEQAESRGFQT